MMKKEKGAEGKQPTAPRRKVCNQRLLDSRLREIKSQESLLLFLFVSDYSKVVTEPMVELIWNFMEFLKSAGYFIVSEKEVFCFPFSKLVRKGDLR